MDQDPLAYFCHKFKFDTSQIKESVDGEKFFGIMLNDGRIGICSNLGNRVDLTLLENNRELDLGNESQRIVVNAYMNAFLNYSNNFEANADIFDIVDFARYSDIVMIGYFESLYEKIRKSGVKLKVFDREIENEYTEPMSGLRSSLNSADSVIITGTAIFNRTFSELVSLTGDECDIFLLGPSNILHADMFKYRNLKMVFGSVFERYDAEIMVMLREGYSARQFLRERNKVYIKSPGFVVR